MPSGGPSVLTHKAVSQRLTPELARVVISVAGPAAHQWEPVPQLRQLQNEHIATCSCTRHTCGTVSSEMAPAAPALGAGCMLSACPPAGPFSRLSQLPCLYMGIGSAFAAEASAPVSRARMWAPRWGCRRARGWLLLPVQAPAGPVTWGHKCPGPLLSHLYYVTSVAISSPHDARILILQEEGHKVERQGTDRRTAPPSEVASAKN